MTNKNSDNDLAQSEQRFANPVSSKSEEKMIDFIHALAVVGLVFLPMILLMGER
jgi:hypothetical protein